MPAAGLKSPKSFYRNGELKYEPEKFLKLARAGKKIAYSIGPTDNGSLSLKNPGIWIEQDHFHVLKVRFPSQVVVDAEDYFGTVGLWYPKVITYSWDNKIAYIKTKIVKRIGAGKKINSKLDYKNLTVKNLEEFETKLTQSELLNEFYGKFR